MFWIFALFTVLLIAFLLPSLIGKSSQGIADVEKSLDIRLSQLKRDFQFYTKELKRRLDSNDLDQEEWQLLTDELVKDTADSVAGTEQAAKAGEKKPLLILFVSLVTISVGIAYGSYYYSGFYAENEFRNDIIEFLKRDPQAIDKFRKGVQERQNQSAITELYVGLRSRVDIEPDSLEAWRDLSFFNASYGREKEAQQSLKIAQSLFPDNLDLKVDEAQMMTRSADTKRIIEGHKLIGEILKQDPNHQGALLLQAGSAYRIGMFDLAVSSWTKLKTTMSGNPNMIAMLDERIADAKAKAEGKTVAQDETDHSGHAHAQQEAQLKQPDDGSGRPGLFVDVQIPQQIMDKLDGNEFLFIFARAANGPKFPIAVVRMQVGDLSGPVLLNDTQAMQAQFALSKFEEVTLAARISFSGSPTAVSGDLEASSGLIKRPFPGQPVVLMLDKIVP